MWCSRWSHQYVDENGWLFWLVWNHLILQWYQYRIYHQRYQGSQWSQWIHPVRDTLFLNIVLLGRNNFFRIYASWMCLMATWWPLKTLCYKSWKKQVNLRVVEVPTLFTKLWNRWVERTSETTLECSVHNFQEWYQANCGMTMKDESVALWIALVDYWIVRLSLFLCLRNHHRGGSFGCVRPSPRHEGLVTTKTDLQGDCSYSNTHTGLGEGSLGESSLGEPSLCELLLWWCRNFEGE